MGSQKKPCEFLGWGVACGNCQCSKKVVCSFKADPYERYHVRISIQSFAERTPESKFSFLVILQTFVGIHTVVLSRTSSTPRQRRFVSQSV